MQPMELFVSLQNRKILCNRPVVSEIASAVCVRNGTNALFHNTYYNIGNCLFLKPYVSLLQFHRFHIDTVAN